MRLGALAALLMACFGAVACDQQGCGAPPADEAANQPPQVVCGPGTRLQAGQCVVSQSAPTR